MANRAGGESELYRKYRQEVEGAPLVVALKRAIVVLFVVSTGFILVDWVVFPDRFWAFLPVRVCLNLVLGTVFYWSSPRYPIISAFITNFAGGAMLLAVVLGTGGASSDYYVGLVLMLIGTGVLVPFSTKQAVAAIGSLFLAYAMIPIFADNPAIAETSVLSIFFLSAAAFIGVMSCIHLDRMRFTDFCQRKKLQDTSRELKELDREKSRFTANVHHELRTPLTLMLAPIDSFLSGDFGAVTNDQTRYLRTMQSNGRRLLKLINDLLDFAKVESRQLRIRRIPCKLGDLVSDIVEGAIPLAEQKGIDLSAAGLSLISPINIDPDAVEKIFINVIGNALKFTGSGGSVRIIGSQSEDGGVSLIFRDDGVGIERSKLDKIFDRFAQVDSSGTRRHEGTGIGLSLARELTELHQGRIWAESHGLGKGVDIHLELPFGEPDESADVAVLKGTNGDSRSLRDSIEALEIGLQDQGTGESEGGAHLTIERGERENRAAISEAAILNGQEEWERAEILIVEDNGDMRRLLRDVLSVEHDVREATNGREALEAVREKPPDLILTDVMMPEMTGTELCQAVKEDPDLRSIPLVLITSKAEAEMKAQGLELGADDYVTKPFHPRELQARVRSLVRVHKLKAQLGIQNLRLESTNAELEAAMKELKEASTRMVLKERLAAVGELAAGIAHEVNNPVNFATNALKTLRMYVSDVESVASMVAQCFDGPESSYRDRSAEISEVMERVAFKEVTKSLAELVEIASEGLSRTHRLVGDLRDFAAPDNAVDTDIDILRSIESTVQLIRHSLQENSVAISMDLPSSCSPVRGQANALNQVFLNLLKNASESISGKGGEVAVVVREEENEVIVSVSDNGAGIADDDIENLFQPFFTTKAAGFGTGMGLSISRRIVSAHNGSIDVETAIGDGSKFTVRLPTAAVGMEGSDASGN